MVTSDIQISTRRPVLLLQFVNNTQVDDVKIYHLWSVSTVTCMFTCMEMIVLILAIQVSVLVSLVLSVTFIEFFLLLVDLMPRCNFFSRTVVSQWAHFDVVRMLRFTFVLGCYDSHALYTYCSFCLLYTSPRPRDRTTSRMPSSA